MAHGKFVAYYRVSTKRQGKSGLGLEAQQEAVRSYLNGGDWELVGELTEVESGRKTDRPKLAEALTLCRIHGATLIIAKLDRLARNVHFISGLMESKVAFRACDNPDANDLTVHILASVAEYESKAIKARTKDALAAAKARGRRLGGKRIKKNGEAHDIGQYATAGAQASVAVRQTAAAKRADDLLMMINMVKTAGAGSLRQIADELNKRGIPTARGGAWSAVQVQRVIDRAA